MNIIKAICVAGLAGFLAGPAGAQTLQPFEFVALGDMPYNIPGDYAKFDRLIDRVNALKPAFTIHVGDIISGHTPCSDENFARVKAQFDRFEGALVYTPGDNEWTDCHRFLSGHYDPLERQAKVRQMFFANPGMSLGRAPIAVESQAKLMANDFSTYVENVRFIRNGIVFASAHIVGSRNNYDPKRPETIAEYEARDKADVAWIASAFELARSSSAKGLVLFWQANVHATPRSNPGADFAPPFRNTIDAVERGAAAFGRPVLVIYGDFHFFEVRPFLNMQRKPVPKVTRLQVYGDRLVHAVRVKVDPNDPALFAIAPLIVPENGAP